MKERQTPIWEKRINRGKSFAGSGACKVSEVPGKVSTRMRLPVKEQDTVKAYVRVPK